MGSPFNICKLKTPFSLPNKDWQDIYSVNDEKTIYAFVYWDTKDNEPGFRVLIYNHKNNKIKESERYEGCCKKLSWSNEGFIYESFPGGTGIINAKT